MKLRHLFGLTCALVLLVATTAAAAETERVQKTVPLAPGGTLRVDNFSGRVTITATDRAEVVIDAVRRATRDRLDRIKLDVQASGATVHIQANKKVSSSWWDWHGNNVVETEMDIQVPRHTNLEIEVFSSPVKVTGITGEHRIHTFSADAHLNDVTGRVRAETFSGTIDVQLAAAASRPDLDLHTFSGDINVRVPATARADVDFNSFSGDLTSDVPLVLRSKSRRSLRGELNGTGADHTAPNSISLKTFSGDVRIRS